MRTGVIKRLRKICAFRGGKTVTLKQFKRNNVKDGD